jgi:hypothetical protein
MLFFLVAPFTLFFDSHWTISMASTAPIKVAAVQAAPVSFDLGASLEKLQRLTAQAAEAGADLVVFP